MGRSRETYGKKEVRSKKEKKRKEKEKSRLAKKEDGKKGSLDDMIAYVDENGMITSTPPDPDKRTEVKLEDISIGIEPRGEDEEADKIRKGTVTYFNESKGYGFIRDADTKESIFVHINSAVDPITEGNLVSYDVEKGPKGPAAANVKLVK